MQDGAARAVGEAIVEQDERWLYLNGGLDALAGGRGHVKPDLWTEFEHQPFNQEEGGRIVLDIEQGAVHGTGRGRVRRRPFKEPYAPEEFMLVLSAPP